MRKAMVIALGLAASCAVPSGNGSSGDKAAGAAKADGHGYTRRAAGTIDFGDRLVLRANAGDEAALHFTARGGSWVRIVTRGLSGPCYSRPYYDPQVELKGPWTGGYYPYMNDASNDDAYAGDCGWDAELEYQLPRDGTYQLLVREWAGEEGDVEVSLFCDSADCSLPCDDECPVGSWCNPLEDDPVDAKLAPPRICEPDPAGCATAACEDVEDCRMEDGAPVCRPMCPEVLCTVACEHGYATDENGCRTCECLPGPGECATDEDCSSREGYVCDAESRECVPDQSLCDGVRCAEGICRVQEVQCVTEPCPPQAVCVDPCEGACTEEQHCQWCGTMETGGWTCLDPDMVCTLSNE